MGYAGVLPTNESFQGFVLFICIDRLEDQGPPCAPHCPNIGQHDAPCPAGKIPGFNFAPNSVMDKKEKIYPGGEK